MKKAEETVAFSQMFNLEDIDDSMKLITDNMQIKNVRIFKKTHRIEICVMFNKIISEKIINLLEHKIKKYFNQLVDVKIKIKYELENINEIQKIMCLYWENVLHVVDKKSPLCKGILCESNWEYVENRLVIFVKDNNLIYLKKKNIEKEIENLIKEQLDININVLLKEKEILQEERKRYEEELVKKQEILIKELKQNIGVSESKDNNEDKADIDDSPIILGKAIVENIMKINDITEESGNVTMQGLVLELESREIKDERIIISFGLTDYTNSIYVKSFIKKSIYEKTVKEKLKKGIYVKVKGIAQYDNYSKEVVVMVRDIMQVDAPPKKKDMANVKRVELHMHTQMSQMDAVTSAEKLIKRAIEWGHKAVAITDHGVVQAFPEAMHTAEKQDIKIIYGMEAYIIDDLKNIVQFSKNQSLKDTYVVFDIETTGFHPGKDKITEIGAVKVQNGQIIDRYSTFVNPQIPIPAKITQLTSITDEMVKDADTIDLIIPDFLEFVGDSVLVAHNASFDVGFITYFANQIGIKINHTSFDTVELARKLFPNIKNHKLNTVAEHLEVSLENHHRAVDDAYATAEIFVKCIEILNDKKIETLDEVNGLAGGNINIKKEKTYHAIILVQNNIGMTNLYKLVSNSHVKNFAKRPRIAKSEFLRYKQGLILGSACEAGELYKAVLEKKSDNVIRDIVNFYDYLEIQPLGNNRFMIEKGLVKSEEDLKEINKTIIKLGERYKKPVVATCDVHFMDPRDEIFRRIIMKGQGFDDADSQPPLYFRTTDEMLQEFEYLGKEKAREVVITNTNLIADRIENVSPISPEKCPPIIEGAEEDLRRITSEKAKSIYGEELPDIVKNRLERELNSIIGNGYAVMYIIAQKLVWKSMEDGYLVGSRGSVGSSFAATMAGITEVNPLSPHYVCPNCKYSDFDSEEVKKFVGMCGCDMPDKKCPHCGTKLNKDGHDIPFETFLGFEGDKEPDIDLNFSGEYQSKAHDYTELLFGKGKAFRAGTIGTLAEKTAYGYVKKYFDEKGIPMRNAEINRLVQGCTGIKKTTGQHPGGIIVLPYNKEIYDFTPIQWPANDDTVKLETTHFDYHSIDQNLLKLDILGHDDPTMIRMLQDLTGIQPQDIPLDDKKVMSLFLSTEALGIKSEDIDGCTLGAIGVPEFGTNFVLQMLLDTKPKTFYDLICISGLSHGTDVWLGNAQTLIADGKATISTVISTRDDIMVYLINKGVQKKQAFTIMEGVRKGKGLKPEQEEAMKAQDVPDWYITSCKQIKYMFPKAHAVAYVTMAFRIAYFKVYYPKEYYAAMFTIRRCDDFDYEILCKGKEKLEEHMKEYKAKGNTASPKEKELLTTMRIVQEMYARGINFVPIDLYKVDSKQYLIFEDGIMPALSSIQGLGASAAENIVTARENGEFLSVEDFRQRTKVSKTVIEMLKQNKILVGIPDTSQMSLF